MNAEFAAMYNNLLIRGGGGQFQNSCSYRYIAIFYFCDTYRDTVWPYRDIFKSIYSNHKLLEFVIALKVI